MNKNDIKEEVKKACGIMQEGGIILYPTDTIWGIGCDATNEKAVDRIFRLKERDDSKSMLVLTDSSAKLDFYVSDVPEIAIDLIDNSDQPLTIIYEGARNLAPNLIAADGSVGIRITNEMFSKALCMTFRKPVVSTSANISGESSPRNFIEISETIIKGVDYVVNYRREDPAQAVPSGIIKVGRGGLFKIIRK